MCFNVKSSTYYFHRGRRYWQIFKSVLVYIYYLYLKQVMKYYVFSLTYIKLDRNILLKNLEMNEKLL